MDRVYLGNFSGWGNYPSDGEYKSGTVSDDFEITIPEPRFVFAAYETPDYDGCAAVITSDDGKVFHVAEGSHSSCYGLEGQFDPTPHAADEVLHMINAANYGALHTWCAEATAWLSAMGVL